MKVTTDACLFGAWMAEKMKSMKSAIGTVLDIGAGTGLLSLMVAQTIAETTIDTVEIDQASYEQASENITASPWGDRINIHYTDVKDFKSAGRYNIIISNPPFYEKELKGDNPRKNIAHHDEGLLLHELLGIIKKHLESNGIFYLLLPYKRNEELQNLIKQHELALQQIVFVRRSIGHDYLRIMLEGKLKTDEVVETIIEEISITDEKQQYTSQFRDLLKEYYLYL